MAKWLQRARESMERRGTVGKFTKAAKKGEGTSAHASRILHSSTASGTEKKEANFARMAKRHFKPLSKS